jgi:hypothetical protein
MRSTYVVPRVAVLILAGAGAPAAWAQTTGTLVGVVTDASTGRPLAGVAVVATSPNLQGERIVVTDGKGSYRMDQLPPGTYAVAGRLEGFLEAARGGAPLGVDTTLRVNLSLAPAAVELEEAVVRTGRAPAIDVGSAETGLVVKEEFIESIPVRNTSFADVAVAAPTAQTDFYGIGFAGGQSPENRYAIDGMDVTDPLQGVLYVPLVSAFVEQVDVKAGNYAAEYGRATGGMVSAVTKSGSNTLSGSIFTSALWAPPNEPVGPNGQAIWTRDNAPGSYLLETGAQIGGPILKDKLWFHLGFAPQLEHKFRERYVRANVMAIGGACPDGATPDARGRCRDAYNNYLQYDVGERERVLLDKRTWQFHAKLTWTPVEDQTLTFTAFGTPVGTPETPAYAVAPAYLQSSTEDDDIVDVVGRWNARFLDRRLVTEAQVGWHLDRWRWRPPAVVDGYELDQTDPIIWNGILPLGTFEAAPQECAADPFACPVQNYRTGGWGYDEGLQVSRLLVRASAGLVLEGLGSHLAKLGADVEQTAAEDSWSYYNWWWRHSGSDGTFYARGLPRGPGKYSARSTSPALFLQDSWQPFPSLTVNAGLRWEAQAMDKTDALVRTSRVRINDAFAPRVQAVWDPTGRGRAKLAASWGRFYESIPLLLGVYGLGSAGLTFQVLDDATCPGYAGPTPVPLDLSGCSVLEQGEIASGVTPVAPDLKGQYVDQFAVSAEWEPLLDLVVGVSYEGRRLGRVIEDLSSDGGRNYFIANPGVSRPFEADGIVHDARNTVAVDPSSGREVVASFPKPERRYDGLTLRVAKTFSRRWLAEVSYTWSRLTGNFSGLFRPETNQLSPNLTSDYDLPMLMTNRTGYLPADRTHTGKLYAAYRWPATTRLALSLGAAFTLASGRPVNALGADAYYGNAESFLVPRGMAGRTPTTHQLDGRATVEWTLARPYSLELGVDVFNLYNQQTALSVDERWTFSFAQPIAGTRCSGGNPAGGKDPIAGVLAACPELAYLKTLDGSPVAVNPNYGRARSFQQPRAWRLSVTMSF